jgi:hypothetical protein
MTREDTIRMAREALVVPFFLKETNDEAMVRLQDFAALVAAAERKRLRSELDQIRWMGAEVGWDLAVEAIQDWLQGEAKSEPVKNVADHSTDLRLPLAPGASVGGVNQSSGMVQQKGES